MTETILPCPAFADLDYCRRESGPLRLDLYLPEDRTHAVPVVLWFHGGGWRQGDKGNPYLTFLLEDGFAVADVQYRLTDIAPAPANFHDCRRAVAWLGEHAEELGLDAGRIAVSGGSAGGHLALLFGAPAGALVEPGQPEMRAPVRGICSLCGPTDITRIFDHPGHPRYEEFVGLLSALVGGPLADHLELARAISPVAYVCPDHIPVFVMHGAEDSTVDVSQAREYVSAMQKAGAPITYYEEPEGRHGRDTWRMDLLTAEIRHFFQQLFNS